MSRSDGGVHSAWKSRRLRSSCQLSHTISCAHVAAMGPLGFIVILWTYALQWWSYEVSKWRSISSGLVSIVSSTHSNDSGNTCQLQVRSGDAVFSRRTAYCTHLQIWLISSHHAELLVLPIHGLVYTESLQFIATPTECYSSIALGAFRLIVCDCRSLGLWYLPNESENGLAWWMILTCGYDVWVQRVKGQGLKVCS